MADDPITEEVEEVTEPAPEPNTQPDINARPPWVDELLEAVTAIPDAIKEQTPEPTAPDNDTPGLPNDGGTVEHDESPVSQPWTHKMPFRK